ncbi:hypothetical protein DXG01_004130 [Tephrocybe rancida]|nr:hypothetical protein DXG01_004130 [Tephrocybe rancida]
MPYKMANSKFGKKFSRDRGTQRTMPSLTSSPTTPIKPSSTAWCSPSNSNSSNIQVPPPNICASINDQVTSNPALARPLFDFAGHVRSRSYVMRNFLFDGSETSVMLDEGVDAMLPESFEPASGSPLYTFKIGDAGDKGRGMFALRDLPAGGLILVEHPIIVAPYLVGLGVPLADIYAELLDRLPLEMQKELLKLHSGDDHTLEDTLEEIVRCNALGIQLKVPDVPHPEIKTHRAVFLNISRCNHSCGPNARWEWDTSTFSLYLSAVRPIIKGDEITVQYTPCTRPRHDRHAALQDQYGFTCRCSYCDLPSKDAVLHSDNTRIALSEFWSTLPPFEEWCIDHTLPDDMLVKMHLDALRMIKQEGLQVLDGERHVDAIAMCYGALADTEMFRAWTERVRDAKANTDPAQELVFAKWLSNPTSFPAWGWKKTFCGRTKASL